MVYFFAVLCLLGLAFIFVLIESWLKYRITKAYEPLIQPTQLDYDYEFMRIANEEIDLDESFWLDQKSEEE